jgi:lipopolysaccharide transport protein LptA
VVSRRLACLVTSFSQALVLLGFLCVASTVTSLPLLAAEPKQPQDVADEEEPITIRADRAWEDADGKVMHLEGNFLMRTSEWEVKADRAQVEGPVEAPDRIISYGKPASIRVSMGGENPVDGFGYSRKIIYQYEKKLLELHQDARLEMDNVSVTSEAIIYDVGNRRLISTGKDGVQFELRPEGKSAAE